ncbi:hypothetical protein, partial [Salmonella sp. SAL4437]|uniref:hypothetical protein n=1 Tax=Salmonella sp. SAL4437 TaxID=3159892 RepID=UPI0039793020
MKLDSGITLSPRLNAEADPQPFLTLIDIAASQPAALADMWQHVVDGLTEQIGLLDENWKILVVNRSWAKVAELYGP